MTIPKLTPYTGQVANPDGSQTQTEFTQNMFGQLSYEAQLATELDATIDGMNNAVDEVNENATSAENSADAAQASANFEGEFVAGVTSAERGKSYSYDGDVWLCLQNTTTTPSSENAAWKLSVGEKYVTKAQEQQLPPVSKIYPTDGSYLENGMNVTSGTTHLRVLVGGKPTIVVMSPVASGSVSLLTDVSATIGGVKVFFNNETEIKSSKVSGVNIVGTLNSLVGRSIEGEEYLKIDNEDGTYSTYRINPTPRSTRTIASIDLAELTITQNPSDTCKLIPVNFDDDSTDQIDIVKWKSRKNSRLLNTNGNAGIKSISIMGDSISHGAFSGDVYRNNWTNIVKRLILDDVGQQSYGFIPIQWPVSGAGPDSTDIIGIPVVSGFSSLTLQDASHTIAGFAYQSLASGSSISFNAPPTQQFMSVWYSGDATGGTFDILINGVVAKSVNTSLVTGPAFDYVALEDNGRGNCEVEILTTSASNVEIQGVSFGVGSLYRESVNNFSQAGRRLAYVDDSIIEKMCQSQVLIMCLGHNDQPQTDGGAYDALFKSKIDALITYANQYKCQLYINNFVWNRIDRSLVPRELKRLHQGVPGSKLLAWNEMLDDGEQIDSNYLVNTIQLWDDGSHPNIDGHEMIGEVVAQKMKLGGNTKRASLRLGLWMPIKLQAGFLNNFTSHNLISAARLTSNNNVRLSIKNSGGTALSGYSNELIGSLPSSDYYPSYSIDTTLYEDRAGVRTALGFVRVTTNGDIRLTTDGSTLITSFNINISLPIN